MSNICSKCGFENPWGIKFCGNCGANLQILPEATTKDLSIILFYINISKKVLIRIHRLPWKP